MSDPLLPGPAAYRRPDPDDMAETELMLRQKLTENQSWNQMAPPPVPVPGPGPVPVSVPAPVPPIYDSQLAVPGEVPTLVEEEGEEAPTPDAVGAKKTPAKSRTRAGTGAGRTSRRRKPSSTPIKDESDNPSSEEFTMEGIKTKSGRKVHRPAHFNPAQKQPSRRRGPYRRIHDSRICKICQRGHSPQSNMIVFCDGCNTPFHQLCHDPPIDDLVIAVAEAEWFCSTCAKKREEKPLATGLSGQGLTEDEKRTYLASLPLGSLVELVFFAERAHPDLPLYDPQTRRIVEGIKRASVAAVAKEDGSVEAGGAAGDVATLEVADVGGVPNWEDMIVRAITAIGDEKGSQAKAIFEWLGNNYPAIEGRDIRSEAQGSLQSALRKNRLLREGHSYKVNPAFVSKPTHTMLDSIPIIAPGSGIKLPPETEDLLVDDDLVAFSHKWRLGVALEDQDAEGELDAEGEQDAEGVEDVVL